MPSLPQSDAGGGLGVRPGLLPPTELRLPAEDAPNPRGLQVTGGGS